MDNQNYKMEAKIELQKMHIHLQSKHCHKQKIISETLLTMLQEIT